MRRQPVSRGFQIRVGGTIPGAEFFRRKPLVIVRQLCSRVNQCTPSLLGLRGAVLEHKHEP